jgi:hypothetical protein
MKRRKLDLKPVGATYVYERGIVKIAKEDNAYFFEIGSDLTTDVAEAVALLMRKVEWNDEIWNIDLEGLNSNPENITPEKALFWLSGGSYEWRTLENYCKPWCDCCLEFQEEFGMLIYNIVKRTKSLREIRDSYVSHLSLPVLYDFALGRGMVR